MVPDHFMFSKLFIGFEVITFCGSLFRSPNHTWHGKYYLAQSIKFAQTCGHWAIIGSRVFYGFLAIILCGYFTGAPTYMAPEVLQGTEHSICTDLWSLGCVLYEMFTGHPPFRGDSFQQLADKVLHHDLPPPKVKGQFNFKCLQSLPSFQ